MRVISADSQVPLAKRYGSEPLIVVGLRLGAETLYFGDRTTSYFKGQILQISDIETLVTVNRVNTVTTVTITLIDVDDSLYQYYQNTDLHKKSFCVYQYFVDTNFATDKILLFSGYATTPITYDLTAKTLTITGTSKLEDIEVGFSPDNAVWRHIIPNEIESKAWPMPFGSPINYPLTSITKVPYGSLVNGYGIPDFTIEHAIELKMIARSSISAWQYFVILCEGTCIFSANSWAREAEELREEIESLREELIEQAQGSAGGSFSPEDIEALIAEKERAASHAESQASQLTSMANHWHSEQVRAATELAKLNNEIIKLTQDLTEQTKYAIVGKTITIWNGKTFPQGHNIWLNIGGSLVRGYFKAEGEDAVRDAGQLDTFYVNQVVHPKTCCYLNKHCAELSCTEFNVVYPTIKPGQYFNYANETARAMWTQTAEGSYTVELSGFTGAITDPNAGLRGNVPTNFLATSDFAADYRTQLEGTRAGFVWIPPGSRVRIAYSDPVEYVISIIPCTVIRIAAYRTYAGERHLIEVPTSYYSLVTRDYGDGLIAQVLVMVKPLSTIAGAGFEDEVYATVKSTIGPNVVDIIQYLIEKYLPSISCDTVSFAAVKAAIESWPAHFVLLTRKNILQLLTEICHQACLVLWYSNGVAYLRYLLLEAQSVATITTDNIDINTLSMFYTSTEDVVTKMIATYNLTYDQKEAYTIALRYNCAKYGTVETSIYYYIYTNRNSVVQSATYWALRLGNTWKMIKFTTAIDTLHLESMDTVKIHLPELNIDINGIVEDVVYNTATFTITYTVWLPLRAGETTRYKFIYADNAPEIDNYFPAPIDWLNGNGLGSPILRDLHEGKIADHFATDTSPYTYSANKHVATTAKPEPTPRFPAVYPGWQISSEPNSAIFDDSPETYDTAFEPRYPDSDIADLESVGSRTIISLHNTRIIDLATRQSATLATIFASCAHNPSISSTAPVLNLREKLGVNSESKFELKLDESSQEKAHGAKLAFLKDK